MHIKKPSALSFKSHAELRAILSGDAMLPIDEAQEIAAYAIQCELETAAQHPRRFAHFETSRGESFYPQHEVHIA